MSIFGILTRSQISRTTSSLLSKIKLSKIATKETNKPYRGFAFSQEENGRVNQSTLIGRT